ncbi:MAG TPA: NADH-quinone oxidoreductase subunit M [Polyangia bacterium]
MGILGWTTLLPILGALLVMLVPKEEESLHRGIGLLTALVTFGVSLLILGDFDNGTAGLQLVVNRPWVSSMGINFHLGVDGISLWLVLLTTLMVPVTLFSPQAIGLRNIRVREFTVAVLVMETGMIGAFLAADVFLFYVFWELMLVPMYFIIGIWGGERRLYASIKFVIYTLVGSLLMLAAILYLYVQVHALTGKWTFDYATFASLALPREAQLYCFGAFALAFLIKVPLFPLHTWLPDAHVEAPTGGSVILAAVMLKFGTYGLLRFAMAFFPLAAQEAAPLIAILSVIGIIFGALMAYVQDDVKKLVAYSSVSHLGFVVIGLLTLNAQGIQGAIYQMLAHGISTGGLFLGVGVLYERRHTRRLDDFGGLWKKMPLFSAFFLIIVLASVGLPGLCGFVGEFLILLGVFTAGKGWETGGLPGGSMFPSPMLLGALSASAVILAAMYLLTMYQKIFFGPLDKPENRDPHVKDIHGREVWVFAIVAAVAFVMGVYPKPVLDSSAASVDAFMASFKDRLGEAHRNPDGAPRFYPALADAPAPSAVPAPPPPPPPAPPPAPGGAQ